MKYVMWMVLVLLGMRQTAFWWRMWRLPSLLKADRDRIRSAAAACPPSDLEIYFVLPAFREVSSLPATFHRLCASIDSSVYQARIVVVTSVCETGSLTTAQVAEKLCADKDYATWVEDPNLRPSMASAFNRGLRSVWDRRQAQDKSTYVVCYNADTTASLDSAQALGDKLTACGLPEAAQLVCLSLRNSDAMTGPWAWYLRGAAYQQTRWAMGFEFAMFARNGAVKKGLPGGRSYHMKGQGLVLRLDQAVHYGGLSEQTPLEDIMLGFQLSLADQPVYAVPVYEDTDSPESARALIKQKGHWFSGMWDVLKYHRLLPAQRKAQPVRFEFLRLGSLYRSAACFLLGPVPHLALLAYAALSGQWFIAVLPLMSTFVSVPLMRRAAARGGIILAPLRLLELFTLPLGMLVFSLTRNIGPLRYLAGRLR